MTPIGTNPNHPAQMPAGQASRDSSPHADNLLRPEVSRFSSIRHQRGALLWPNQSAQFLF
jgi:hypothetical protein